MTTDKSRDPQSTDKSTGEGPGVDQSGSAGSTRSFPTQTEPDPPGGGERATPDELREDIERTRADLGETAEALAAKANLKARAKEAADKAMGTAAAQARDTFQATRYKAGPVAQQAQLKAREFATKARGTAASDDALAQARRGGLVGAATCAILLAVWVRRRRRARRLTRWQRTVRTAQQTGAQVRDELRDRAAELGATVRDSDVAARTTARGQAATSEPAARARQAAADPDTKPRAQGAAAVVGALLILGWLRGSRAARRSDETE